MKKFGLKYISTLILLIILNGQIFGQDVKSDLLAMKKVYMGEQSICLDLHYYTHVNTIKGEPIEYFSSPACFKGMCSYQMVDSVESIINESYSLIVDHKYKTILRRDLSEQEKKQLKSMNTSMIDFESFLQQYNVEEYKKFTKDSAVYTFKKITTENPQEIKLIFNPKNHRIIEVQVKSLAKQEVVSETDTYFGFPIIRVLYKNQNRVKKDKSFFTDKKYLKKVNNKFVATKQFSSYEVVAN